KVADAILNLNQVKTKIPNLDRLLIPMGMGSESPLGNQSEALNRQRSNRVEFRVVGQRVQGEHGYRFFPNFYRHIFDTMKRTPVFDDAGKLTPETTFDQLVSTPDTAIGFEPNRGLIPLKLRHFTSIQDLKKTIEFFKKTANFTDRDLLRLQTHFVKYMTSCKK